MSYIKEVGDHLFAYAVYKKYNTPCFYTSMKLRCLFDYLITLICDHNVVTEKCKLITSTFIWRHTKKII